MRNESIQNRPGGIHEVYIFRDSRGHRCGFAAASAGRGSVEVERVGDGDQVAQPAFVHRPDLGVVPAAAGLLQAQHQVLAERADLVGAVQLAQFAGGVVAHALLFTHWQRAAGLPTADLPASACLSSRLPYGTEVTPQRLAQVEQGEERLRELGFRQVRLRHHGDVARIEIEPSELALALDPVMARKIVESIKPLGFKWVSLDLEGYRMGSLNQVLTITQTRSAS